MNKYTVAQCKALLEQNNIDQPKARYSNNILLTMLDQVSDNATVEVEPTKGGFELNRGSLAENIVKMILLNTSEAWKTQRNRSDVKRGSANLKMFGLDKWLNYEVKFATSFANASSSEPKTKYVILVTPDGAYLVESKKHVGKWTTSSIWDGERLDDLSEALGL